MNSTRIGSWSGAAVVALAVLASTAACGSQNSSGGAGELTLYSAQHQQTTSALVAAFTAQTGIKVKVENDDEDKLTAKIQQEGGKSPADVFYTENSPWLAQLDAKGLLAPVDGATLDAVPKQDSAASGKWVGVSARITGITYNTSKLTAAQLPKSIMNLADPQWKDKIEIAPGETDFWPVVSSVLHTYGRDRTVAWLQGLKNNAGSNDNVQSNETLAADISQGNTDLGVLNHYYFYRLRTEVGDNKLTSAFAFFAPHDAGYVQNISGAGVLASSTHKDAAQKFLAFLTSTAGQTVLATSDSFEYPLRAGVAANPQLPPLAGLAPTAFSVAGLGTGADAQPLLQQVQLL
ncbi:extracellular solute-binding protein [Gordonia sp. TBRC 11910]|uniref:Extracellular solute-binding protein n=1 Tax=Gordonia asplenii TaxID=2725283 RepID=A0A848L306_9ACTN|nr:extracellular solute-binding protein [Gordonia asplenii]NMO05214.1 extracellular solute-binding protein [Gordonia asplenii]